MTLQIFSFVNDLVSAGLFMTLYSLSIQTLNNVQTYMYNINTFHLRHATSPQSDKGRLHNPNFFKAMTEIIVFMSQLLKKNLVGSLLKLFFFFFCFSTEHSRRHPAWLSILYHPSFLSSATELQPLYK